MNKIAESIKWLVFTNLYIALAAVCFQGIISFIFGDIDWPFYLSVHTFFSTWFVYQFSRWSFNANYEVGPSVKDEMYQFLDEHKGFTKISIIISGLATGITLFFLEWNTLMLLGALGAISVIYPIKLPGKLKALSLRRIPFLKIFMIAFVWACTAVWVPVLEVGLEASWRIFIPFFLFQFFFILLITLPFDIADLRVDKITGVKTIPSVFGWKITNYIMLFLEAVIGVLLIYMCMKQQIFGVGVALVVALFIYGGTFYAIKKARYLSKLKVMKVFDGSMILLYLLFLIFYKLSEWM